MSAITYPAESSDYRAARDRLLEQEIELRRAMEASLPRGGNCRRRPVSEDYVFQGTRDDGTSGACGSRSCSHRARTRW